jgi:alpha-L-fucosidase 2
MIRRAVLFWGLLAAWAAPRALATDVPWTPPANWIPDHGTASTGFAGTPDAAMVTGNGTLGVMVVGAAGSPPRAQDDRLFFSHAGLFLPVGTQETVPQLGGALAQFRQTIRTRGYSPALTWAQSEAQEHGYQGLKYCDPFLPALELSVKVPAVGAVRNYLRSEDFATGEVAVRWTDDAAGYVRKVFVSRARNVAALWIGPAGGGVGAGSSGGADAPKISCELALPPIPNTPVRTFQLNSPRAAPASGAANALIEATSEVDASGMALHCEYRERRGSGYDAAVRVVADGGAVQVVGGRITVKDAAGILVLLRIEPFANVEPESGTRLRQALAEIPSHYDDLLAEHTRIHSEMFNRVALDLGGGPDRKLTSDTLLARARDKAAVSTALLEKLYEASRYELLCAAGAKPPNLKGLWTSSWAPTATQAGEYLTSGPLQLSLASALSCRTPELLNGLFAWSDERLTDWRLNARNLFGAHGLLVPARQSSNGKCLEWSDRQPMGLCWTAGGAMLAHEYFDYFLFTGDRKFLADKAVPFMKEVAAFYEDFLTLETNGKYRFSPSFSTDNAAGDNSTVDIMVASELLTNLIAACRELKIEPQSVARWQKMLDQLPEYLVAPNGELQEWSLPGVANKPNQRHIPHLYAVYPARQFDPETTPELWKAARAAFDARYDRWFRPATLPGDSNGLAIQDRLQMGLCAARFGDGAKVGEVLARIAAKNTFLSLMTQRFEDGQIFDVEGAGAFPEIVNAALLDSRPGRLDLLPALPPAWTAGEIRGLAARSAPGGGGGGRLEVRSLKWSPAAVDVELLSTIDQTLEVRVPRAPRNAAKRTLALKASVPASLHVALQ